MLAVLAPVAASAQTSYPTVPTNGCNVTPTVCTSPAVVNVPGNSVSSSSGTLAFTGGNIALLVGLGLIVTVGGVVLVRVGRRAHASS
jgi:beta-lactamase regulating signal transducer with metallopeptidase domain